MIRCADRLGQIWDKGVKSTAMIAIPILLLAGLLGRYEWIIGALVTVFVAFRIIRISRESFRQPCPACGAEGAIISEGRKLKFECPKCGGRFDTDCEISYAGARPSQAP
ncbi:MAG TPA: hypothetical protein VF258_09595 [Luteolibacter sp.]